MVRLLNNDDNSGLVKNEEVKYYTLIVQVLIKIVFFNLLLKLGEYNHARDSAPLIYCLLKGIRVNIPKLLIDFMLSEHLMISSRNLPYGMIVTHLLRYFKIDISSETAYPPSIDIDRTFLKRMQSGTRAHAQPPPVQLSP